MPNQTDLLSVADAAVALKRSTTQIHRQIAAGKLPAQKLGPGTSPYVIRREDVDRVLAEREAKAQAAS